MDTIHWIVNGVYCQPNDLWSNHCAIVKEVNELANKQTRREPIRRHAIESMLQTQEIFEKFLNFANRTKRFLKKIIKSP